ncbi:MAG: intradiol ring-cleavage dioxygenase [Rhizobiales bacterium]|nr:intradiol ring-cleavage dioxygenase [Hyphomicrobiales bacterium]MBO6697526.1 intradiol ring-cleavage dioxygenase [Hyphomicrobiales bacterium]MBO6736219.1 intradiol ring-cleavage dioxygenase [Hyphomicrobiales bacterium]MBO6912689.1 intradiol ring-cleavage dioxygenase [Hyphomicrobiales bacterium]MBO6956422.1 intradiol ring-cleavage dioxygenase [Hyphomicrobiales bacterium]
MALFTEETSESAVNSRMGEDINPRLATVMASLVKHLHAFAKDVELTQDEWGVAIDFLTRTGQMCDENRQEFILLSDTLGVSMLVDAINHRRPSGATENTVLGPFHVVDAPHYPMGQNISLDGKGESCLFEGRVLDRQGNAIANATIDVWCDNADGFYDVQQPDVQPKFNNRGIFTTGADGAYSFRGIRPVAYPIPDDGPVGQMLAALGRHPNRPAHMHFIVSAPGYERIITHTFVDGDEWLTSDAVFGVKASLISTMEPGEEGDTMWKSSFDFIMVEQD